MGRNRPRSKAVDVTKSLLQPTSITDHIAVQIATNNVIQVAEDDLSPTQGSEAAFALRREGKLDASMKLCLNWRQGNCHNHAACSFAHVIPYFGVSGDGSGTPATPGKPATLNIDTGGGFTYSSAAAGGEAGGRGGNVAFHASWQQKGALPLYPATTVGHHMEDDKTVSAAARASATASAQLSAVSAASVKPEVADSNDTTEVGSMAPYSNASAPPPAGVPVDGLRSILMSLAATLTNKAALGIANDLTEPTDAGEGVNFTQPYAAWLREMAERAEEVERATLTDGTYSRQQPLKASISEFVEVAGKSLLGEPLWAGRYASDLYHSLADHNTAATATSMRRPREAALSQTQEETTSHIAAADLYAFSTAPPTTEVSCISARTAPLSLVDLLLDEVVGAGAEDDNAPAPFPS
ncbi:hypothetical protein, conserved [Leishmania tarentolae]|uniref:C3H1-type domain-containing protein n=1 Tax=Leishmania tarentolae TaxID=5689 RepID=A0A640KLD6_LEITA|nr:hypothetical protein, conserved [Leishmania tarentolae]